MSGFEVIGLAVFQALKQCLPLKWLLLLYARSYIVSWLLFVHRVKSLHHVLCECEVICATYKFLADF